MNKVSVDDNLHLEQSPRNLVPRFSIHLRCAVQGVYLVEARETGDLSAEIFLLVRPSRRQRGLAADRCLVMRW
jgi:hypothetical protein